MMDLDEIWLKEWEEVVGTYQGIEEDVGISVVFDGFKVGFNPESTEVEIIRKKLEKVTAGVSIAILKTDIPEKPLVVRIIKETEEAQTKKKGVDKILQTASTPSVPLHTSERQSSSINQLGGDLMGGRLVGGDSFD
jgi:hypothetical protein